LFCFLSKISLQLLDPDTHNLDEAIATVLSAMDQGFSVEKIMLDVSPSVSSTSIMVTERKCQGSDTLQLRKKTIRREYLDI